MIWALRRLWWRWRYLDYRNFGWRITLSDWSVRWAWSQAGHLNTRSGQLADVILRRARRDPRFAALLAELEAAVRG